MLIIIIFNSHDIIIVHKSITIQDLFYDFGSIIRTIRTVVLFWRFTRVNLCGIVMDCIKRMFKA